MSMIFSTNSELLRPKRSTKPNKSKGRGSFAIPEKFPNHFKCHITTEHETIARYECSKCDKSFASKVERNYHMMKHSELEETDFTCEKCEEKFMDMKSYNNHRSIHKKPIPRECNKCGIMLSDKRRLGLMWTR